MTPNPGPTTGRDAERRPSISVVVPSHERPVRLRWLLNALEEQTLPRDGFEVVVVHDSTGEETARLLTDHPLTRDGTVRQARVEPCSPGTKRNIGWRSARAPVIAFTDDDCRPPSTWLERALAAARANPGAVVQGETRADPDEQSLRLSPHHQTNEIVPPTQAGETCNIVYPRAVLERLGGFDEVIFSDDTDLAIRARKAGIPYVAARQVISYHAVHPMSLPAKLRWITRWEDLPSLVRRHPELRRGYPLGMFFRRTHVWLPLAAVGAWTSRRNPAWALLAVPWIVHAMPYHGPHPRGRLRAFSELAAYALADAVELGVFARGSIKHRTLFL